MNRRTALLAAAAPLLAPAAARAQTSTAVRVIGFTSGTQLPMVVARAKGFFGAQNLDVTLTPTPGSVYQFQQLSAGNFELASTALDNVIAYDEGQTPTPLPNPPDFVTIMGGDSTAPNFWVRPEIAGFPDVRGKTLAVDAVNTGFSFILRRILQLHGIPPGGYDFTAVGNTSQRFAAMKAGTATGGMLDDAFTPAATAAGFRLLQRGNDAIGPYGGFALAARRAWLSANGDVAVRFLRGMLAALNWMLAPANRDEARTLLAQHIKVSPADAVPILAELLDPPYGFTRTGDVPPAAVQTVIALREAYGVPKKTLGDAGKYYDPSYLQKARS